jgi:hypothetical protein
MQIRFFRFRLAAAYVARELAANPAVSRVALIGSVAGPLWKEVPRFRRFRRHRVELWHECTDVDLAVWMTSLDDLKAVQRARARALSLLLDAEQGGVAHHQVELFVLEPGSNRYLGRVCGFRQCPAEKRECLVEGCGASLFLQQHAGFVFDLEALTAERSVVLFDRPAGPPGSCVEDDEVPF